MHQFPSGGLNQSQMIDHIKFITKDLFKKDFQSLSSQKLITSQRKKSPLIDQRQCKILNKTTKRLEIRPNDLQNQSKKKRKWLIFEHFEQFIETIKKPKEQYGQFINEASSQNTQNNFKKWNILEQKNNFQKSLQQNKMNERVWSDFLRNESKWLQNKKRMYQHFKTQEQDRTNSLSKSRKVKEDFCISYADSRQLNEVQKSIARLRYDTQTLKAKILSTQGLRSSQKKQIFGLKKTFKYGGL